MFYTQHCSARCAGVLGTTQWTQNGGLTSGYTPTPQGDQSLVNYLCMQLRGGVRDGHGALRSGAQGAAHTLPRQLTVPDG